MTVFRHFTDDGISGTCFDRPGFQNMIDEVRVGNIEACIIKDMSRFGRDYLQVGSYMEVLRKNDTRLIALNDNVDTLKGDDEFTPFRNIMNEWYARDTSKKIRSAYQAKNLAGKHTSSAVPYGYLKSEKDKDQWVIDPVAAPIVKRIFQMSMEGKGPYQISKILSDEHIEVPAYYHQKMGIGL
jgi:DNA invertase Pin-like site-specific DNA recombinase